MKKMQFLKSLLSIAAATVLLFAVLIIGTNAASYPLIYPKEYEVTVTQGETAELVFTIFHEYKNEKAFINVHKDDRYGAVVATSERNFYNVDLMTEYTVTWDTSDVTPGKYVVEYYMGFYSFMEWHEAPTRSYLLTVYVKTPPCPNGHTFDAGKITKKATCSSSGTKTFTCIVCEATEKETLPKLEHIYDEGKVTKEPTCKAVGTFTTTCTLCKKAIKEDIPKLDHVYDDGKVTKEPTCKAVGTYSYTCTSCKSTIKEEIPMIEHTWAENKVIKKGSAVSTGSVEYKCSVCKKTKTEAVPAIFKDVKDGDYYSAAIDWAYNNSVTSGTSATTFAPDALCTRGQVVTFLWRASGSPEPATTENNFIDVKESDYFYKAVLWAVENSITSGVSPKKFAPNDTCSNAHILTFVWRTLGKPEATGEGQWYDDPLNWAKKNNLLDETNVADDVMASCPRANIVTFLFRTFDEDARKELEHTYGEWQITTAATCAKEGVKTRVCTECNKKQTRVIPVVDHNYSDWQVTTAATCTRTGEQKRTCSMCSDKQIEVIAKIDHNYGDWQVTTAATCTKEGEQKRTCSMCSDKQTEAIAKLAHNYGSSTCDKPATCSVCGITTGSAKGHTWVAATCTVPQTCSVCKATGSAALGHTTRYGTCSRCNMFVSEPLVFSGTGDKIITNVTLEEALYKISLSHTGKSNFIIVPYDGNGDRNSSWVNEIGTYTGSVVFNEALTNGYLEVKADGAWTVKIERITTTGTSNLSGNGDCVSAFFTIPKGAQVVKMNYTGNSNFIVIVYDETGRRYSSLANEIGSYSGEKIFNYGDPNKKFCVEVTASGPWTVDFGLTSAVTTCTPGK